MSCYNACNMCKHAEGREMGQYYCCVKQAIMTANTDTSKCKKFEKEASDEA